MDIYIKRLLFTIKDEHLYHMINNHPYNNSTISQDWLRSLKDEQLKRRLVKINKIVSNI